MIKVCGTNIYYQIDEHSNCKSAFGGRCISPPTPISFAASSVSSLSSYLNHTVIVARDGEAYGIGDNSDGRISVNLPLCLLNRFTRINIYDQNNKKCFVISAVCGANYTLYLIRIEGDDKTHLAYSSKPLRTRFPAILNTGNSNLISLFGGIYTSAAVDSEGGVLFVSNSISSQLERQLEVYRLPSNDKVVNVVCCNNYTLVLGKSGKVFISPDDDHWSNFSVVSELENMIIKNISGISDHCFVVSNDGKVFGRGENFQGCLGIGKDGDVFEEFTYISPLEKYTIQEVFAAPSHTFFRKRKGMLLACGDNHYGQLAVDGPPNEEIYPVVETTIKNSTFCVIGCDTSFIFIECDAPQSPNRKIMS
ncbi:putative E3 ubiquitin-protein ligase herc4 [Tritrichomonas musculus]|uniref:E3 ubiquitin-protein ligase herc4 n=1 Tax=Tritrichomonas musculus TaxID=1915356 RepID=A0ABR2HF09_9EUKA